MFSYLFPLISFISLFPLRFHFYVSTLSPLLTSRPPGPGADEESCEEVHADEGKHPGGLPQDPDPQVAELDGAGHEGRHQGHDDDEQADEAARDPEDHAGVREAVGDHGHEGGDDE